MLVSANVVCQHYMDKYMIFPVVQRTMVILRCAALTSEIPQLGWTCKERGKAVKLYIAAAAHCVFEACCCYLPWPPGPPAATYQFELLLASARYAGLL